jgi:NADPH:quinone reductase-like Zn-dependent oxidoreductase
VLLTEPVAARTLKPVIDRRYPLEAMVAAHRYVDDERKQGKVVITIAPNATTAPARPQ